MHASLNHSLTGFLFDVYHIEETIHIWLLGDDGRRILVKDVFYPAIYANGNPRTLRKFYYRLKELDVLLDEPVCETKLHFYKNKPVKAWKFIFKKPSFLKKLHRKLYAFTFRLDIYHCDIEPPTAWFYEKNLFPLARGRFDFLIEPNTLEHCSDPAMESYNRSSERWLTGYKLDESHSENEYAIPSLRILHIGLESSHRLGIGPHNPFIVETDGRRFPINGTNFSRMVATLNHVVKQTDPDAVVSTFGDQVIFPQLFDFMNRHNLPHYWDRDSVPFKRQTGAKNSGTSFSTYGSVIYRARSYPFFGRWHIDSHNSFLYKESELMGILELARMSKMPVQRMTRASTGMALTNMEVEVAVKQGYLVPWQKSAQEEPKTAFDLLQIDKGGLQFQPDIRSRAAYEQVAQIDFSQMYPTIMVHHNISPETVLCDCCRTDPTAPKVPEADYNICTKRRGVVSTALAPILKRRRYLKAEKKSALDGRRKALLDAQQGAIKWLLVTSFGYLGYRNAKFGRIESHESVTAFGREKLLTAKEKSEEAGFEILHGVTDCLFIKATDDIPAGGKQGAQPSPGVSGTRRVNGATETGDTLENRIDALCSEITQATSVEMSCDGVYSWVVFVPSRVDGKTPIATRYFGRFEDGEMKIRGIMARRSDTPEFIRECQQELLAVLKHATCIREVRRLHKEICAVFYSQLAQLEKGSVPWHALVLRRTASREEYANFNANAVAVEQLKELGVKVQAGEKVRYIVHNPNSADPLKRYIVEEKLQTWRTGPGSAPPTQAAASDTTEQTTYSISFYSRLLWEAFHEVWFAFAPEGFFSDTGQAGFLGKDRIQGQMGFRMVAPLANALFF